MAKGKKKSSPKKTKSSSNTTTYQDSLKNASAFFDDASFPAIGLQSKGISPLTQALKSSGNAVASVYRNAKW